MGHSWEYNHIFGWIGLYSQPNNIVAEYYIKNGKRVKKSYRNKIEHIGDLFHLEIAEIDDSDVINNKLLSKIQEIKSYPELKNFFIDSSKFEKLSGFINWKQLITNF